MVATAQDAVPDDIGALRAPLTAALARAEDEAARAALVEAELAVARAKASDDAALIAHQDLTIRKLQRALHGQSSERSARLHDQMELTFEELESTATQDEIAAEQGAARTTEVAPYVRKRPARQPFPEHLPRESWSSRRRPLAIAAAVIGCASWVRISPTLEVVPRQWKVIQHVREKFTCRDCETISQAPAPFHATPRGWAGPGLLAMILFEKFGQHQPLNRQAERYAREGVPLSLSTLADQVGAGTAALMPLFKRLEAHVLAASRLHGDDTTVPVLAKGKTDTGRLWTYVRDDRPFGGADPPAAVFYYSRDRRGEQPAAHLAGWNGILQADAFGGYGDLYATGRQPAPVLEASCWAHSRRKVFELADVEAAARKKARSEKPNLVYPLAVEAVKRIDALFDIERAINGLLPAQRHAVRQERSAPLVTELERWMIETRDKLSRGHDLTKAFNYMLRRWSSFTRFLDDGRICLSNNAAELALRGIAISGSFCPCWAGGRGPLPLAPVFRTSASLREQRRARRRPDHSPRRRARSCHYRSGLDDRSRGLRGDGPGPPARIACRAA
ncbi:MULTISPECIES: IS66 family transposase [unclassified Mesorhizobium]|uniref:IS66 family transposase n=1 Tax=unclassified Mesorhizobium TaxID=325217 RepID=UPI001FE0699F|nr:MULTISPECIES: IS66 family transposase [unclassified Mesorhizobium]